MQEHPLKRWLDDKSERRVDFARCIGCSPTHLTNIAAGRRGVSLELALAIERETGGAVIAEQLLRPKEVAQ